MSSKSPWPRPGAEDFALLQGALRPGGTGAVAPPPPSAVAWLLLEASRAAPGLVVAVADTPRTAEELCADLEARLLIRPPENGPPPFGCGGKQRHAHCVK